jgi:hypothetical protein
VVKDRVEHARRTKDTQNPEEDPFMMVTKQENFDVLSYQKNMRAVPHPPGLPPPTLPPPPPVEPTVIEKKAELKKANVYIAPPPPNAFVPLAVQMRRKNPGGERQEMKEESQENEEIESKSATNNNILDFLSEIKKLEEQG